MHYSVSNKTHCYPNAQSRVQITCEKSTNIYMLFAGWEVRMVKNCDRGLENTARGNSRKRYRGPWAEIGKY